MYIVNHGGFCCGVRTIHNLGYPEDGGPDHMLPEIKKRTMEDTKEENALGPYKQRPNTVAVNRNIYQLDAPRESRLERLKRYISWYLGSRVYGVIEVVIADDEDDPDCDQTICWEKPLADLGFKLVTSCYNSNSCNRIYIYHLAKDKE